MQPDRFTIKSQEAVAAAQRLASEGSNPEVGPPHLLVALLEQDEGVVVPVLQRLGVDSQLIGPDFRANPQFLIPNRTPGEFGQQLFIRDKNTFQWDISITKTFPIPALENGRLQVFAGFTNVLNHPRWAYGDTTGNPPAALNVTSTSFGVINGPTGNRTINLRATISF